MKIRGLNTSNIKKISQIKNEESDVLAYRLDSFSKFQKLDMPLFGPKLDIDFSKIVYYESNIESIKDDWSKVDQNITNEFCSLGVLSSEKKMDGIGVQYQSEVIYHNMIEELKKKNVIFTSIEDAFKNHKDLVKKYFGTIVSNDENKFVALNGSVFSGGSFIYVPKNTVLDRPLQSYFRISSKELGQFERTLIIVDDNSSLHYIEGCTAKSYTTSNLHAAVVEIYVGKNSKCRYTTIQNWSNNVYNLVTKRALVEENGLMEWIDGNVGSYKNMKYPCCILKGDNSKGSCVTIAVSSKNQIQDTGAKMIHLGKNTESSIISKSIARSGGVSNYRGKVYIDKDAVNSNSIVKCDTLILDKESKSDTYPSNICCNKSSTLEHEATVSRISYDKLFYLTSRGLKKEEAMDLIIMGFAKEFKDELPVEYAIELKRLLESDGC